MESAAAIEFMRSAIDSGRANRGFIVAGAIEDGIAFVSGVLKLLFTDNLDQIEANTHPDVHWLYPEGRSRTISVDMVREYIVEPTSMTSFSGGWKVGIVVGADRMNAFAANALLKSLEEPPPQTVYFLLTDNPESCISTVISRSQRIDLPRRSALLENEDRAAVEAVFLGKVPVGVHERMVLARRLTDILGGLKEDADDESLPIVRKRFYQTITEVMRRWMLAGALEYHRAFHNLAAVQEAYERSNSYLGDEMVLSGMMERISFPPAAK